MIDAVLDANTLASGSLASSGTIALLIEAFLADKFRDFLSPPIYRELERTLAKPYFARRLTPDRVADGSRSSIGRRRSGNAAGVSVSPRPAVETLA